MKNHHYTYAYALVESYYFTFISSSFIVIMLISNIIATVPVIFTFGSFSLNTDGAFYIFPLSYVLGDVLTEIYGLIAARKVIFLGFGLLILSSLCFHFSYSLPHGSASHSSTVSSFEQVAVSSTIFIVAGLAGYLCGELLNSSIMSILKTRDGEHKLYTRLILATIVSELADTTLFCCIASPALKYSHITDIVNYIISGFLWKCLVEILVLPITGRICAFLKHHEKTYSYHLPSNSSIK